MAYIKVKDQDYLLRDSKTNAIINSNQDAYDSYVSEYKRIYEQNQRVDNLENDMNDIKNDLNEIKNLLRNLANGS